MKNEVESNFLAAGRPAVEIHSLADFPEHVEAIGRWYWSEWGSRDRRGTVETWIDGVRRRRRRNRIPTQFIALASGSGDLLGAAALVEHDLRLRAELHPWLAGVYVRPDARGRGIGRQLVEHATAAAAGMHIPRLYLQTSSARGLYEKLGWEVIDSLYHWGEEIDIMKKELTADS